MSLALSSIARLSELDDSLLTPPLEMLDTSIPVLDSFVLDSFVLDPLAAGGGEAGFGAVEGLREKKLEILCCFLL